MDSNIFSRNGRHTLSQENEKRKLNSGLILGSLWVANWRHIETDKKKERKEIGIFLACSLQKEDEKNQKMHMETGNKDLICVVHGLMRICDASAAVDITRVFYSQSRSRMHAEKGISPENSRELRSETFARIFLILSSSSVSNCVASSCICLLIHTIMFMNHYIVEIYANEDLIAFGT